MRVHKYTLAIAMAALFIQNLPASAQISVYINAPGDNNATDYSHLTHTTLRTESFDSIAAPTLSSRVYLSTPTNTNVGEFILANNTKLAIINNRSNSDKSWASSQAIGNYAALGAQSGTSQPITLNLPGYESYFGFSWNAGDNLNQLWFLNDGNVVGYYTTATVNSLLNNGSGNITNLTGTSYSTSDYYGQPGTGANPSIKSNRFDNNEPFAFLNFLAPTGVTFNQVVFGNHNSTGSGFEFDNPTIVAETLDPLTQFVSAGTTIKSGSGYTAPTFSSYFAPAPFGETPEPGRAALMVGLASVYIAAQRRRQK